MKKKFLLPAVIAVLLLAYILGSGFMKCSSVYVSDFSVSDDGQEMTIRVFSASSAGYIRKVTVHQQYGGKLYLDCISAFGGINGSIGARSEFSVPLAEDTGRIALYRAPDCYEEILKKDSSGLWQRVS